jgi:hypothetical protein
MLSPHLRTLFDLRRCSWPWALVLLAAVLGRSHAFAQVGIKLTQFRPTGELGYIVERKFAPEFQFIQDFEDPTRMRFSFLYLDLQPRLDTFPSTGYISDSNEFRVLPG